MVEPRPIVLTSRAAVAGEVKPEPVVVVGGLPAASTTITGGVVRQPAIANQAAAGTLADLAAAQTAINAVTTKLNAALAALRSAGVLTP